MTEDTKTKITAIITLLIFVCIFIGLPISAMAYEGVDPIATPISEPIVTPIADPIVYSPVPKEYRDTEE
jgi:hypothetical protein